MIFTFTPLTEADAREVLGWHYTGPYALYNPDPERMDEELESLTNPENQYFAIRDARGDLVAHACYGKEAQVPGGTYPDDALDMGCGLRPDLTGHGIGPHIIEAMLDFGREKYGAQKFRATIAAFNERAQRASQQAGFEQVGSFERPGDGLAFVVLRYE